MSKGGTHTPFNKPKDDGHKLVGSTDIGHPMAYCTKIDDVRFVSYTTAGIKCPCGKIF